MSPTREQKFIRGVVDGARRAWSFAPRRGSEGRNGRLRPETPFSDMHRARAEAKRERRRQRRLDVDRWGYTSAAQSEAAQS